MGQTASNQPGEQRRRSTRMIETVPLTVRGVDLLGQPFEERTSTLVLNFHGCRYSSKHHLPKNTWLTLEIPEHSEERGRRCLRARVAWIQRPRSVRELFQIGVELESPGNVWGIEFPPEDWNGSQGNEASPVYLSGRLETRESGLEFPSFVSSGGTVPPPLANYIDRLLADSRQNSPGEEYSAGTAAAVAQTGSVLREVKVQLQEQAEKTVAEAASRTNELVQRATEEINRECSAGAEALRAEMREEFERLRREAAAEFAAQFAETQQSHRESLSNELEDNLGRARDHLVQIERQAGSLRAEIADLSEGAGARFEQIRAELEAAEAAALQRQELQRGTSESDDAAGERASAVWREQVQAETSIAREQWNELLQSSLDSAVQRLVGRLAETSQGALASAEQRMGSRLAEISAPAAQIAAEARETLSDIRAALELEMGRARASLGEIEQAANRMSEYSAQLEAASQDTVNELHRRLDGILAAQVAELNRRAESLVASAADRLLPQLKTTGQEFIRHTVGEVEGKVGPHVERAQHALRQLSVREEQVEETLRVHRERLRQASEQNQRECANLMSASLGQLQTEFEEERREALRKWTEELDASGVRATHAAAEKMVQATEWYEKKAQSELDTLVEGALAKGAAGLDLKAGEASARILEELQEQRAKQLDEAKILLEAASNEVLQSSRGRFGEAADAAASSFGEVLRGVSAQERQQFAESSHAIVEEQTGQIYLSAERARKKFEEDAGRFCEHAEGRLAEAAEKSLGEAQKLLAAQLASALEDFSARRATMQQEWLAGLEHAGKESAGQFEERLHSACDSWMITSLRKLNEHGQNVLDSLSKTAEQNLRQTCSIVFDGLAETMRERMLGTPTRTAGASATADASASRTEKQRRA